MNIMFSYDIQIGTCLAFCGLNKEIVKVDEKDRNICYNNWPFLYNSPPDGKKQTTKAVNNSQFFNIFHCK